ncbi:uncharacterized protein G2W53_016885 [Senna tora]|uniref:Retrotransposon Copia-like N-terminal domain-containing protein n=1 Tax=Senna tora TaxID=362788 RepID=A0A834TRS4_9FABA|nr:uncharacterized protein G2W53_016885 [Senna tora]
MAKTSGEKRTAEERAWTLTNSDQPGMSLVVSPLTTRNYLGWSIAVRTALEAKGKVGFIDGTLAIPTDPDKYCKWKEADSMIKSWIVNSMIKELADMFVYCGSTKELWSVLEERYGRSCGP